MATVCTARKCDVNKLCSLRAARVQASPARRTPPLPNPNWPHPPVPPRLADEHMSLKGSINSGRLGSEMWAFVPRVIVLNKSRRRETLAPCNRRQINSSGVDMSCPRANSISPRAEVALSRKLSPSDHPGAFRSFFRESLSIVCWLRRTFRMETWQFLVS